MEKKRRYKEENGITLIALVITLIILIILSVVTLNEAFGDEGLIRQAEQALDYQANGIYSDSTLINQTYDIFDGLFDSNNTTTGGGNVEDDENNDGIVTVKFMDNPPTIENVGTNTTIQNSTVYVAALESADSSGWNPVPNEIYTSYNSTLTAIYPNIVVYNRIYMQAGNWPKTWTVEFTVDCKEFEFKCYSNFRISVDEGNGYELTSFKGYVEAGNVDTESWFKVTFDEKKERNIRIELGNGTFGGVNIANTDTIQKINRQSNKVISFIGDSITEGGILDSENVEMGFSTFAATAALGLGLEYINAGIGGTGYLDNASVLYSYYDAIEYQIQEMNPDIIVISGGLNDVYSYSSNDIVAEAERCYEYVQTNAPNVPLIVIGIIGRKSKEYTPEYEIALNTALRAKCLEMGIPFIDLIEGETIGPNGEVLATRTYITGNGNIGNITGNGNADIYISADEVHPTLEGQKYLGEIIGYEIGRLLEYMNYSY